MHRLPVSPTGRGVFRHTLVKRARFIPPWERAADLRADMVRDGAFLGAVDDTGTGAEEHFRGAPASRADAMEQVRRLRGDKSRRGSDAEAESHPAPAGHFMPYGAEPAKVCPVSGAPAWGLYVNSLDTMPAPPELSPEQAEQLKKDTSYTGATTMALLRSDNETKLDYKYTGRDVASSSSKPDHPKWPLHGTAGLVLDIDGVVFSGKAAIEGSEAAIRHLQEVKIPFVFMTNGGGTTEAAKARQLSSRMPNLLEPIRPEQVILAHTPMRDLVPRYAGRPVLIAGPDHTAVEAARGYGFDGAVGIRDVQRAHPELVPLRRWAAEDRAIVDANLKALKERVTSGAFDATGGYPRFDAVFVYNDGGFDALSDVQVIIDVLTGPHGQIGSAVSKYQTVPLYMAADDLLWPAQAPLPRLGQGAIREMLASAYESVTGQELQVTQFGKPRKVNYDFALKQLKAESARLGWSADALRTACMVGDNLESDILGANAAGGPWLSVHVLTGVGKAPSAVRTMAPGDDEGEWLREHVADEPPHYIAPSLDHFVRELEHFGEAAVTGHRPARNGRAAFPSHVMDAYRP